MTRDFKTEIAADQVFVGRLIAREEQAWREFQVNYGRLFKKIIIGDNNIPWQEASEVWSKFIEKLIEKDCRRLKLYRGKAIFAYWLSRVITNLAADWHREQEKEPVKFSDLPEAFNPGADETIGAELDRKKANDCLQKALAALSPERRRIYELVLVERRSYTEVAGIEKINTSTVGTRWLRTREALCRMVLDCCGMDGNNNRRGTSL